VAALTVCPPPRQAPRPARARACRATLVGASAAIREAATSIDAGMGDSSSGAGTVTTSPSRCSGLAGSIPVSRSTCSCSAATSPTRRVRAGALPRVAGQPAAPAVAATFFAEHDVLAVTYDRPGYGRSDPQPDRRVLDAAADVAALVDHLQLETFVVMGVSGGGPHTLACTYALPRAARGRRHPLVAILAMAAAAVLAGARSMTTIAEWAADAPQPVRTRARCPPPRPQPPRRPRPRPPPPDPGAPGPAAWPAPSAPGWPIVTALGSHRGGHGRWPWTARPYAVPATKQTVARSTCWPDGPHQPRGAGPTPARRRPRRGLRRAAAAGRARLGRCGGHRRRAADPPAGRLGSWSPTSRPTTCWSSRPTNRPCWAAASACPGSACPWGTAPVTAATAASSCAPSRR
jgi:pimeloyl-ACP methyl ester carboxylesterase